MEIAIVRAAHLHVYLDALREIGVPVERDFGRSGLSPWVLDDPDAYIGIFRSLEWLASCSRDVALMDLGFLAARRGSLATLSRSFQRALHDAPTGFARLQALRRFGLREDNILSIRMRPEGDRVRLICDMAGFAGNPFLCLGEWLDLQAMMSIIRSVAGPLWCPEEMTFVSRQRPSALVQEAFANTRILTGQPHTSILLASELLARPCPTPNRGSACATAGTEAAPIEWSFASALRAAIRPCLAEGYPALSQLAETFRMSGRTLQRRLQECGRSYSDVVQEARFELACELLADPSIRMIDVAMSAGYENPQHFSRGFRRFTGVSPTAYRRSASAIL